MALLRLTFLIGLVTTVGWLVYLNTGLQHGASHIHPNFRLAFYIGYPRRFIFSVRDFFEFQRFNFYPKNALHRFSRL